MSRKQYPKYKPSGVPWLGDVPEGWEVLPIKRIVSTPVTDGPHETPEILDDGIPFISAEAVRNNKINFNKKRGFISEDDHRRFSLKYHPKRNDIYMIKSGATTGNLAIVETDDEFNIWSPLAVIRCHHEKSDPKFVLSAMNSREFQTSVQLFWSYGTQQNIGMNVIQNLVLPIPPLPEQQAIAAFLDRETGRINALIEKKKRLIALLKEKRSTMISRAVTKGLDPSVKMKPSGVPWLGDVPEGWEVKRLKFPSHVIMGQSPNSNDYSDNVEQLPFLQGNADFTDRYPIPRIYCDTANKIIPEKSLLISVRAPVGALNEADQKYGIGRGLCAILPKHYLEKNFAWYGIQVTREELNTLATGSTYNAVSADEVANMKFPLPPLPEQQTIAAFLDRETSKIDALVSKVETAIDRLKEYRTSLISSAVTGKIDVRGEV